MSQKRAGQRSYAEWDRLVDEWSTSGERQDKFAEAHGINPKTFQGHVWRSRKRRGLSSKGNTVPCQFLEVSSPPEVESPGRGQCRITISNTQIEFSSSSDAEWIAEILSRLGHLR